MSIEQVAGAVGMVHRHTASAKEGSATVSSTRAWEREMERAQLLAWFQPLPNPEAGPRQDNNGNREIWPEVQSARPSLDLQSPAVDEVPPHRHSIANPALGPLSTPYVQGQPRSTLEAAGPSNQHPFTGLQPLEAQRIQGHLYSDTAPAAKALPVAVPDRDASLISPSVSVHVDPSTQGATVWIGLPARIDNPDVVLDSLLQSLMRRLRHEGAVLQSLTVNGQTMWAAPLTTQTQHPQEEA
jgi:hypothetical protein